MTWATRNENGDNMGNTMIQPALMPMDITKAEFAKRWDRIFKKSVLEPASLSSRPVMGITGREDGFDWAALQRLRKASSSS